MSSMRPPSVAQPGLPLYRTDKDVVAFLGEAWPRATALTRPSLLLERNPLRLNGVDPTPSLARG